MCLSVPRQVAAGGVMLATVAAGVLGLVADLVQPVLGASVGHRQLGGGGPRLLGRRGVDGAAALHPGVRDGRREGHVVTHLRRQGLVRLL